ncbi:MAG: transcriptional repressor [Rhodobiaceae bacterium]|nr:transcriptional repressor [Rhodobiaceae bacterium]MCC0055383.1 transcriptional repressor [Rhodobiaceae bacterium]
MAKPANRIEAQCVAAGLRMTGQRRVIAQVLSASEDHPDVEELYRRVSAIDAGISMSTVYRTIRLLQEKGILAKLDFGEGRARYEQSPDKHHDHLIDMETGNVVEFHDAELEALQERIARRLGYRLVDHRMELFGMPLKDRKDG